LTARENKSSFLPTIKTSSLSKASGKHTGRPSLSPRKPIHKIANAARAAELSRRGVEPFMICALPAQPQGQG